MSYFLVFCAGFVGGWLRGRLRDWWGDREDWRESPKWGPVRSTWIDSRQVGFCYFRADGWIHGDTDRATWRRWPRLWGYTQNTDR